jgi:hypothetical protein
MMSATRVAHRTSPSTSLADSSSMHMTMKVTYFVYVNPVMWGNCEPSFFLDYPVLISSSKSSVTLCFFLMRVI